MLKCIKCIFTCHDKMIEEMELLWYYLKLFALLAHANVELFLKTIVIAALQGGVKSQGMDLSLLADNCNNVNLHWQLTFYS